jgi:hypothetical protein
VGVYGGWYEATWVDFGVSRKRVGVRVEGAYPFAAFFDRATVLPDCIVTFSIRAMHYIISRNIIARG